MTVEILLLLFAVGVFTGVAGGYLGIGGAVIVTPVLLELYRNAGFNPAYHFHLAFGTSLMVVIGTSVSAGISYARAGRVIWRAAVLTGSAAFVFSIIGSRLAALSPSPYLLTGFVLFLLFSAGILLLPKRSTSEPNSRPSAWVLLGIGAAAGLNSAYLGVAGGVVMVLLFILWAKMPVEMAPGTSNTIGIMLSIVGTLGYIVNGLGVEGLPEGTWGFVVPAYAAPLLAGTLCGGPVGSLLNRRLGKKIFRFIFAAFLVVIAVRMALSS